MYPEMMKEWRPRIDTLGCALMALFFLTFSSEWSNPGGLRPSWYLSLCLSALTIFFASALPKRSKIDYIVSAVSLMIVLLTVLVLGRISGTYDSTNKPQKRQNMTASEVI